METMVIVVPQVELGIGSLRAKICQFNTQQKDLQLKNSKGSLKRLMAFTLLDYKHQFMRRLNIIDSRSWTQALGVSLLFTQDIRVQLILYSGMLNQIQNWIMREPIFSWVLVVPALSSYILLARIMRVGLALGSLLYIRTFW